MPRFDELRCGGVQALLEPYVDGEVTEIEAGRLEAHLADCSRCAAQLRLAIAIRRELRGLPELEAPAAILARTLAAVAEAGGAAGEETAPSIAGKDAVPGFSSGPANSDLAGGPTTVRAGLRPPAVGRFRHRDRAGTPARRRRFALPVAAGIAALLAAAFMMLYLAGARIRPEQPSRAEVAQAAREARFALAYVGRASRQAALTLRDEVIEKRVVLPTTLSAERPLHPILGLNPEPPARKGT